MAGNVFPDSPAAGNPALPATRSSGSRSRRRRRPSRYLRRLVAPMMPPTIKVNTMLPMIEIRMGEPNRASTTLIPTSTRMKIRNCFTRPVWPSPRPAPELPARITPQIDRRARPLRCLPRHPRRQTHHRATAILRRSHSSAPHRSTRHLNPAGAPGRFMTRGKPGR